MNYEDWSSKELAKQLSNLGFGQYERDFRVNDIKGVHLPMLTEEHLKEMGIESVGHRILIMKKITDIINGITPNPINDATEASEPYSSRSSNRTETESPNIPARVAMRKAQSPSPEVMTDSDPYQKPSGIPARRSALSSAREESQRNRPASSVSAAGDDDKVVCEYCGRRLAPDAAARHIPVCAKIRSKGSRK